MIDLIKTYIQADIPVLIWGPPGIGKTASILALAEEYHVHTEVLIGSQIDPIDVGGYLIPHKGEVQTSAPPWARRLRSALDANKPAWLILDELSCAPASVQAALLRVVHDRVVADVDLKGCRVIAAANPADTAADGGELSAATANRWAHLDWTIDAVSWATGTLNGWGKGLTSPAHATAASSITTWVTKSPGALLSVPTGASQGRAWPSPRSWSAAIRALAIASPTHARRVVAGCVGDAAASEWYTFHSSQDLPNPEDVLNGSVKIGTKERGDRVMAILSGVVAAVSVERPDKMARIAQAWSVLSSLRPDVIINAAKALLEISGGEVPDEAAALGKRLRAVSGS